MADGWGNTAHGLLKMALSYLVAVLVLRSSFLSPEALFSTGIAINWPMLPEPRLLSDRPPDHLSSLRGAVTKHRILHKRDLMQVVRFQVLLFAWQLYSWQLIYREQKSQKRALSPLYVQ